MTRRALFPLSPSSQFGRRTGPTHRPTSQALTALTEPADAMRTILSSRLAHLRVIGSLWAAGGAERALTKVRHSTPRAPLPNLLRARSAAALMPRRAPPSHAQALDLDELPVLVDVLNASQLALQRGGGLELLQVRLAYVSLSRLRSARRALRFPWLSQCPARPAFCDVLMHASATVPTSTPSSDRCAGLPARDQPAHRLML